MTDRIARFRLRRRPRPARVPRQRRVAVGGTNRKARTSEHRAAPFRKSAAVARIAPFIAIGVGAGIALCAWWMVAGWLVSHLRPPWGLLTSLAVGTLLATLIVVVVESRLAERSGR